MKPQSIPETHKKKGWVPFSTFAFVDEVPKRMNYVDHLMPYQGADKDLSIPWGVYGTTSLAASSFFASHHARAKKKFMIVLTLFYYIEDFAEATATLPRSLDQTRGFLHTARLGAELREELQSEVTNLLRQERSPSQMSKVRKLSWPELLISEPAAVRKLLRQRDDLHVIVHPVQQKFDPNAREAIQIGSFKLQRERVMAVEARYHGDIVVEI